MRSGSCVFSGLNPVPIRQDRLFWLLRISYWDRADGRTNRGLGLLLSLWLRRVLLRDHSCSGDCRGPSMVDDSRVSESRKSQERRL